jgi:hypothetical protein
VLPCHLLLENVRLKIYKADSLPGVLYGFETWSVTSSVEHRLRVFENRLLRRIFGLRREEVTGGHRKLLMRNSPNINIIR